MPEKIELNNFETQNQPNLNIPNPPSTLKYVDFEDFRQQEILKSNSINISEEALIEALKNQHSLLRAAAAHTLGHLKSKAAVPHLKGLLKAMDDYVRVEAAYALSRIGEPEGKEDLIRCLDYPMEAYLCPPFAAGYLARLGNSQGYLVIQKALKMNLEALRMAACKQLIFFMPFDNKETQDNMLIDVKGLFALALENESTGVQWQALVQLKEAATSDFRPLLESYLQNCADESLKEEARTILSGL